MTPVSMRNKAENASKHGGMPKMATPISYRNQRCIMKTSGHYDSRAFTRLRPIHENPFSRESKRQIPKQPYRPLSYSSARSILTRLLPSNASSAMLVTLAGILM